MFTLLLRWITLLVLSFSQVSYASSVKKKMERNIFKSGIKPKNLGFYVSKINKNEEEVFKLNEESLFIPASLTKIVTAASSLSHYELNHRWKTELVTQARIKNGVLKGDLILVGYGDPSFTSESMWNLVNEFTRTGIKKIEGDILVDDSYFDSERYSSGRQKKRVDRSYDAPIGALSFNWNSVNFFVRPGSKVGMKTQVWVDPTNKYIKVINKTKTVYGRTKNIKISRVKKTKSDSSVQESFVFTGSLGLKSKEVVYYKNITEPALWAGYNLKEFLSQRGIIATGKIAHTEVKSSAKLLADVKSRTFSEVVSAMMKYSNNFVTEMLVKSMGVNSKGPATMKMGMEKVRSYLSKININQYKITSPSGLSRENKFKPKDLYKVLKDMKFNSKVYPEFLISLPISGIDGSLKSRMKHSKARSWVRAKTGRLNGVAGLAGYIRSPQSKDTYAFVFIYNGPHKRLNKALSLFDSSASLLVKTLK